MTPRVRADIAVAALLAQVEGEGGFGAVLRRGDRERGDVLILVTERGILQVVMARQMDAAGAYSWTRLVDASADGSDAAERLIASRQRFDPDLWLVELDVADSERFIAERLMD